MKKLRDYLSEINPAKSERYSKAIYKYIESYTTDESRVWLIDPKKPMDQGNIVIGERHDAGLPGVRGASLSHIGMYLGDNPRRGVKNMVGFYSGFGGCFNPNEFKDIMDEFMAEYVRIGRCAFFGSHRDKTDGRYDVKGRARKCKFCGHTQTKRNKYTLINTIDWKSGDSDDQPRAGILADGASETERVSLKGAINLIPDTGEFGLTHYEIYKDQTSQITVTPQDELLNPDFVLIESEDEDRSITGILVPKCKLVEIAAKLLQIANTEEEKQWQEE